MQKVHDDVARSTFPSQNVHKTSVGALLEVEMCKQCTPLWREARFKVKMVKAPHVWTTFGRSTALHYTTLPYTRGYATLRYTTLHYTQLHYNYSDNYNYTTTTPSKTKTIKGPDNPTCQLLPITSQRKVKMGWERQEREEMVEDRCVEKLYVEGSCVKESRVKVLLVERSVCKGVGV